MIAPAADRKRIAKGKERALQSRAFHWPSLSESDLWSRARHRGFTTTPRTLPIIMQIIDSLSKNQPAGRTYCGLWYRAYDEAVVIIENPMSLAFEAGFSGERAMTTWRQRMHTLQKLGFIDARPGSSGDFHHVLIYNPHKVVWRLKDRISPRLFSQLYDRAIEVGAEDMLPDEPEPAAKGASKKGKNRADREVST